MNTELKNFTTFKIGANAEKLFVPQNIEEFVEILSKNPDAKVLGSCSNVLLSSSDAGEIILTQGLTGFSFQNATLCAQTGVKMPFLAQKACENSLSGLEYAIGFPASVGGAVFMNASANSQSTAQIFKRAKLFDGEKIIEKTDLNFSYRHSLLKEKPYILLEAEFELAFAPKNEIEEKMAQNLAFRKNHQPSLKFPNAGSVFKNPEGESAGRLLDLCGVKGLKRGGARVWEGHANFIINENNASSKDVTGLMFEMYSRVKNRFMIELTPEIEFVGVKSQEEKEKWDIMLKQK